MKNIVKEVAQFQLIMDAETDKYFIENSITGETSFRFDFVQMENLMMLDRNDFTQRCIQRAGNNLKKKIV